MTRAGFEVAFEILCGRSVLERHVGFQLPRGVRLAVGAGAPIMLNQSLVDVLGTADVQAFRMIDAAENVNVVHLTRLLCYALLRSPTRFALRSGFAATSSSLDYDDAMAKKNLVLRSSTTKVVERRRRVSDGI